MSLENGTTTKAEVLQEIREMKTKIGKMEELASTMNSRIKDLDATATFTESVVSLLASLFPGVREHQEALKKIDQDLYDKIVQDPNIEDAVLEQHSEEIGRYKSIIDAVHTMERVSPPFSNVQQSLTSFYMLKNMSTDERTKTQEGMQKILIIKNTILAVARYKKKASDDTIDTKLDRIELLQQEIRQTKNDSLLKQSMENERSKLKTDLTNLFSKNPETIDKISKLNLESIDLSVVGREYFAPFALDTLLARAEIVFNKANIDLDQHQHATSVDTSSSGSAKASEAEVDNDPASTLADNLHQVAITFDYVDDVPTVGADTSNTTESA